MNKFIELKRSYEAKMTEEFKPRAPDYSGDGIAIWKADDKNGKPFLKVTVLGGKAINCFKVEPKQKEL
jgi:hypothetical protein